MPSTTDTNPEWGSSYRLIASEKWKAKSAAMGRHATEALVQFAHPRPGIKILDVASGTGEPAITLATRVGPTGHVTALDLSADLLAIAADRARQRGLTNVAMQQSDAQSLPFPDNSFDLATSRFGVMFFADADRALRELHRVLKPGARACFLVWGSREQPYFAASFGVVQTASGCDALPPTVEASPRRALARNQRRDPRRHPPLRMLRRHPLRGQRSASVGQETVILVFPGG